MTGADARADGRDVFHAHAMADLHALAAFLERACAEAAIGDDAAFSVRLAVEEAFTNIMEHGYGGHGGPVAVALQADSDSVRVVLRDEAIPFDPVDAPAADPGAALEEREPGGLGWHLVHQVMDEVRHQPIAPRGNMLTLVKRLPSAAPGN
jgi:anti-sigma regulatory factor (Ser/Thr protein kinase)